MTEYEEPEEGDETDDEEILEHAKRKFALARDFERDNRESALADIKFGLLSEQWGQDVKSKRDAEGKPCLTINKLAANIRQVVNDSRQNKPAIRVRPVGDNSDPKTAEVFNGLIRNIETSSNADIAYDSAITQAVSGGFGYIRVNIDYADDDTFDRDIQIERIYDQFSVYGDPHATSADGSDWNCCFVVERMPKHEFEEKYPDADCTDFETEAEYDFINEEGVWVAEYWKREESVKTICLLSNGVVMDEDVYERDAEMYQSVGVTKQETRATTTHKVTQYIITGKEVLETNEWAGKYIPIVPVYGEEVILENKRTFKSLIRDAKDAQRIFNYWRTTSTELVALAPKTPFIGEEGAFDVDTEKWESANTQNYAYLTHKKGTAPPQRQPFASIPAGVLQEALNAADDIKATMGMFGASIGEEDNAISGRAIMARQRESDTGTFHFIDNLSRALRQIGRIVIDLVPHVYQPGRILRTIGEDHKKTENIQVGQPGQPNQQTPQQQPDGSESMRGVYDLTAGKYDVVVDIGPGYTTKRQEAAAQMIEFSRVNPQAAGSIGDLIAKNLDWPGADEIAKRLQPAALNPQMQAMQQQLQQMQLMLQQQGQQLQAAQADKSIDIEKLKIDAYKAETDRLKAMAPAIDMQSIQALVVQTVQQLLQTPDVTPGAEQQAQAEQQMIMQALQQQQAPMQEGFQPQQEVMQ